MVQISRGDHRLVVALPSLGVVLKFPRIALRYLVVAEGKKFIYLVSSWRAFWEEVFSLGSPYNDFPDGPPWALVDYSFRNLLKTFAQERFFAAIGDNWRERRYYKLASDETRRVLAPTYWSFLGLVSVQAYRRPYETATNEDARVLSHLLRQRLGEDMNGHGHEFFNSKNFSGLEEGALIFLDYGDLDVQVIIDKHIEKLVLPVDLTETKKDYKVFLADFNKKYSPSS